MNDCPEYYTEFYKEIVKYELNLLPTISDITKVTQDITDKIFASENYILRHKTDMESVYGYTLSQVQDRASYSKVDVVTPINEQPKIVKWTKRDLATVAKTFYRIIPNYSEEDLVYTYNLLKTNNRYVQCGFIINQDKENIYFCITKPKGNRHTQSDWTFENE